MLWHIQIFPASGQKDYEARRVEREAQELHLQGPIQVSASRGFLLEGHLDRSELDRIASSLLVDSVVSVVVPVSAVVVDVSTRTTGGRV